MFKTNIYSEKKTEKTLIRLIFFLRLRLISIKKCIHLEEKTEKSRKTSTITLHLSRLKFKRNKIINILN